MSFFWFVMGFAACALFVELVKFLEKRQERKRLRALDLQAFAEELRLFDYDKVTSFEREILERKGLLDGYKWKKVAK